MEKILLIVDDSKEIIDVVQEVVSGLFDKILTAGTVDEAQDILSENVCSFVILDINLENRNGAEVIKFLIENPQNPNNGCPVVILSGIINTQFVERYQGRFAGIVMKPFDHDVFRKMIDSILKGETQEPFERTREEESDIPYLKCNLPFPIPQLEQKVEKVLEQINKNTKLKQLFSQMKIDRQADNYIFAHVGMLINISTGISIKLEWNTDKTLEKFVYAAYLHDMALATRPDLARIKDAAELEQKKDSLSEADYKLVFEHPNIASRTINGIQEIPPDVGIMVKQHHELPKETGFPLKIGHTKIPPLATVFIVAHDLTDYMMDNPKWTIRDYLVTAKLKFRGLHFQKVLSCLDNL